MFEATVESGVCRLARPGGRWLATGWDGGFRRAEAAYNLTVPEGFDRTDLERYAGDRLRAAGFDRDGPVLLTGVDTAHARGARTGSVTAVATAGLSNPASLPVTERGRPGDGAGTGAGRDGGDGERPGTVNLLVGTTRSLADGTLATLLATAVEAKTATLEALAGVSGTTSDALAVGCAPDGEPAAFAGSATAVGAATRACVRESVRASLESRYADGSLPSVESAEHGAETTRTATVFRP